MLSRADRAVIARDPELPGLETLLDTGAMARALGERSGIEIERLHLFYLRYKPGTNCVAAYELETGGRVLPIYAKAHAQAASVKFEKASARARDRDRGPVLLPSGIVAHVFPEDAKLRVLRRLDDPVARRRLLGRIFGGRDGMDAGRLETLAYKPERRYTARFLAERDSAVLKFYLGDGYVAARRACKALESREVLRLAERRGGSKRHAVLALEWLPGRNLREVLDGADADVAVRALGRALVELHCQDASPPAGTESSPAGEELDELASTLAFLCPELGERPQRLADALNRTLAAHDPRADLIHGDLYDKQVVVDGDRIGLLDLDRVGRGDPRRDLGLLVAHLERDALFLGRPREWVEEIEGTLLAAYEDARGGGVGSLSPFVAEALLRLAHHPFRVHVEDWPSRTAEIIACAEKRLAEGQRPPPRRTPDPSRLDSALSSGRARERVVAAVAQGLPGDSKLELEAAEVVKQRPGRRAVVRYRFVAEAASAAKPFVVFGKIRERGTDYRTQRVLEALWARGFTPDARGPAAVPEPLAVVPELHMTLQRGADGCPVSELLHRPEAPRLMVRVADAIHALHIADVPTDRQHGMDEEIAILQKQLSQLAESTPAWRTRLERLLEACRLLGGTLSSSRLAGVHRDFHPEQVLAGEGGLTLLDFDLYARGDPALDVGNFAAHLTEIALRESGDAEALRACEEALFERILALRSDVSHRELEAYATLTLARHVAISASRSERRHATPALLSLCEERLEVPRS